MEGPMQFGIWQEVSRGVVPNLQLQHLYTTLLSAIHNTLSLHSMASISCSVLSHDQEIPNLESTRALVLSVNEYIFEFLANIKSWNSLKSQCTSKLNIQKQEFFEFSEHSILSNLYWGIESIETAIQSKWAEEKTTQLKNSEKMLQVPALLDEQGVTAGIQNQYLVCCSHFYLSVARKLQNDEWQVALYFLQAMLVSPRLVRTEFAQELCGTLFPSCRMLEIEAMSGKRRLSDQSVVNFDEDNIDESIRQIARRYKHWLIYYQVMLYGETPRWHCRSRDTSSPDDRSQYVSHMVTNSSDSSNSIERRHCLQTCHNYEKVHPLDPQKSIIYHTTDEPKTSREIQEFQYHIDALKHLDQVPKFKIQDEKLKKCTSTKCLQEVLMEYQSDTSTSVSSCCDYCLEEDHSEENMDDKKYSMRTARKSEDDLQPEICEKKLQAPSSTMDLMSTKMFVPPVPQKPIREEANEVNITNLFSGRFLSSVSDLDLCQLELRGKESDILWNFQVEDNLARRPSQPQKAQVIDQVASTALQNCRFTQMDHHRRATRIKQNTHNKRNLNEVYLHSGKDSKTELMTILEKAISKLCLSEGLAKCEEDYVVEVTTIYEILNNKTGVKYSMLKDVILDQLLTAISTSKEERVIRASVSILTTIISVNKSAIEDIKKKGLQLCALATALKRNVHEAAILIYLINPSPIEIKTLELLPALVEVVCTSNGYRVKPALLLLTPPAASLMIIEVLVTAFDHATNNMHLAAINSPRVLRGLLNVVGNNNLEEYISLANILVKSMQFDGQCRKYVSQVVPVAPFICLLQSNEKRAKFTALEFFHEILCMPRSSAINLLQRIQKEGSTNIMQMLMHCIQELQSDYQLMAANLLVQLGILENSSGKGAFVQEGMQIIINSVASDESSISQQLSTFILANLGGTYAWTGEPYTVAWLVKKVGSTSLYHRNMIRNFDWSDQNLQDTGIDSWCSKIAKSIIDIGKPAFQALEKGLQSKIKRVSCDSLTAIAWIGCEIAKCPNNIRYSACEILLKGIEQFLHPGLDLDERLLACLCIYNYASGRGMQKLVHFSEGVRESLRRFSSVTWMAEELHRVAEYYLLNKSSISCVHTQILEANQSSCGAATALIYYRGLLCSGYSNGSIKVWDIKQQSATLVWDMKEHKKAVTCFSIYEAGESLLSGSADKTIRVWQMVHRKLECIEVIDTKEPIRQLETRGQIVFVITQGHGMKVFDSSRTLKDICKTKKVKCMSAVQGKVYIGCLDSSIQEMAITNNGEREIKAPTKSWRMQNKPVNSIIVYKDWLYSASSIVEGSKLKEWRTHYKPQMLVTTEKGRNVLAMGVVEDFIYLNCSSSTSTLQIWLRGTKQKVGRISAGSRITSLLTANDIVLCGTEKGVIKGWIPL